MTNVMKKISVLCLFVLATTVATLAQTSKGTISIGGNISVNATRSENNGNEIKNSTFTFAPGVGYFVADKFMVGAELSFSQSKTDAPNNHTGQTNFSLGPFARYYIFTKNEQFGFYGQAGFSFGAGKWDPNVGNDTKSRSFGTYLRPGFTWFPTEHWGVDFQVTLLSFNSTDPNKDNDDDKVNTVNFGLNTLSPSLGVRYYF